MQPLWGIFSSSKVPSPEVKWIMQHRTVRDPILGELPAHAAAAMHAHTCSLLKREKVLQVCVCELNLLPQWRAKSCLCVWFLWKIQSHDFWHLMSAQHWEPRNRLLKITLYSRKNGKHCFLWRLKRDSTKQFFLWDSEYCGGETNWNELLMFKAAKFVFLTVSSDHPDIIYLIKPNDDHL